LTDRLLCEAFPRRRDGKRFKAKENVQRAQVCAPMSRKPALVDEPIAL